MARARRAALRKHSGGSGKRRMQAGRRSGLKPRAFAASPPPAPSLPDSNGKHALLRTPVCHAVHLPRQLRCPSMQIANIPKRARARQILSLSPSFSLDGDDCATSDVVVILHPGTEHLLSPFLRLEHRDPEPEPAPLSIPDVPPLLPFTVEQWDGPRRELPLLPLPLPASSFAQTQWIFSRSAHGGTQRPRAGALLCSGRRSRDDISTIGFAAAGQVVVAR